MIGLLKRIFTWWHQSTIGTGFTLWKAKARLVGEDFEGNRYFEEGGEGSFPEGGKRRWVVYHGHAEGSRVPPEWHGWLHHIWDEPPTVNPPEVKKFEKPHLPNMTGTPLAYRPHGSISVASRPQPEQKDYEAWSPDAL
ncbi:NADH:ubiquinone oxidoreductase subunit NDUFA12 [Parvularcula lutaonensis]|uniref:NADH:ubiquinone oxidoreductase subunit NDUFA12 n=1 Tax=Parvularcula lutaonensis TaxID=491923 RepID=A0ABV7M863_9PROT|nr:NADH:ubiquinone oxidoreductase subunit NDUFA12 [Parvularcula lutaonensis]GGY41936.1 NADH dehydrogenase [Parvularcula lutaonensis]